MTELRAHIPEFGLMMMPRELVKKNTLNTYVLLFHCRYVTLVSNATFEIWLGLITTAYVVVVAYTFLLFSDGTFERLAGNLKIKFAGNLLVTDYEIYLFDSIYE